MSRKDLLKWMHVIRRDLGNLVVHWTRREREGPFEERPGVAAFEVLCKILQEGKLRGSSSFIKGGYNCVCFTEAPVSELAILFQISELTSEVRPSYEPFGVAVSKVWLFENGGRPVIYQPDDDFRLLPNELAWRHMRYEPPDIDFTWEREWRVHTEVLELEPEETLVILPTREEASYIIENFPDYMAISLDYFGLPGD